tara:strand:- start:345 stop:1679 length:1335 start_codon:yes stop_codon:yes gene_type:complete
MGWYKDINAILEQEPETWLNYLHGQQLEHVPHLTRVNPMLRGFFLRLAWHGMILLRHLTLRHPETLKAKADYVVFAGSANQMHSLDGTANALKDQGMRVVEIANGKLLHTEDQLARYIPLRLSFLDIVRSLVLLVKHGPSLYKELKTKHPAAIQVYFDSFCSVYSFLVYFRRILKQTKPDFVVTSNDHNSPNRAMLAVAHYLGVKTVYLQHASISRLFPALRVNYAFLDGQHALDIYRECDENQPERQRNVPEPQVFLTGQKKRLARADNRQTKAIGIALNSLDDATSAILLVKDLATRGQHLIVRLHPGQSERDTQQYLAAFEDDEHVKMSSPKTETVSDFLEEIRWMVAGNSSIHLEAVLAGVIPIYFELTPPDSPDYYGYVRHGLARKANSAADIVELVKEQGGATEPNVEAIRYYSATYLTKWDGREGELVAQYLMKAVQ